MSREAVKARGGGGDGEATRARHSVAVRHAAGPPRRARAGGSQKSKAAPWRWTAAPLTGRLFSWFACFRAAGRRGRTRAGRERPADLSGPSSDQVPRRRVPGALSRQFGRYRGQGLRRSERARLATDYFRIYGTALGKLCSTREQWEHGNKHYQTGRKPCL